MTVHRDPAIMSVTQLVRIVELWKPIVEMAANLCHFFIMTQYVFVLCHCFLTQLVQIVSRNTIGTNPTVSNLWLT